MEIQGRGRAVTSPSDIMSLELGRICKGVGIEYQYDPLNYTVVFYRRPSQDVSLLMEELFGDCSRMLVINRNRVITMVRNGWLEQILYTWATTGRTDVNGPA